MTLSNNGEEDDLALSNEEIDVNENNSQASSSKPEDEEERNVDSPTQGKIDEE